MLLNLVYYAGYLSVIDNVIMFVSRHLKSGNNLDNLRSWAFYPGNQLII